MVRALLVLLLSLWPALALAVGVSATADRTAVSLGDRVLLTVEVEGTRQAPTMPSLPDFQVFPRGSSTGVQILNGRRTITHTTTYLLVPKKVGELRIGAVELIVDGQTYRSKPFTIDVAAPGKQPTASGSGKDLFLVATVSDDAPYPGQQVTYTLRLYRKVRITNASLDMPTFEGVVTEDLGEQRDYETTYKGHRYHVIEIRKALYPERPGSLTLPGTTVSCDVVVQTSRQSSRWPFDDLFGRMSTEPRRVESADLTLDVKALPSAPDGFYGLIGNFDLKGELSRTGLAVGESTTLTLTVSGTGNAHRISPPALPELDGFKVYDDKPTGSVDHSGHQVKGRRTYTHSLVPTEPGTVTLPAIELVYFDPAKGYRTDRVGPFELEIGAAAAEDLHLTEGVIGGGKMAVRALGDDILPITHDLRAVDRALGGPAALVAGMLVPPLGYLALLGWLRRRDRYASDTGLRRRQTARRNAKKAVRGIGQAAATGDPKATATATSSVLRTYIGDKLGIPGGALTPEDARTRLRARGVAADVVDGLVGRLEWAEAIQYRGGGQDTDLEAVADEVVQLIDAVDRALGRKA